MNVAMMKMGQGSTASSAVTAPLSPLPFVTSLLLTWGNTPARGTAQWVVRSTIQPPWRWKVCAGGLRTLHMHRLVEKLCVRAGGRKELRGQEYRRWPHGYVPYTLEYIQTWLCSTFCIDDVVQSFTLFQ